ncbi:MAG: ABC transporter permease subunit [Bacteroidia bacterium]
MSTLLKIEFRKLFNYRTFWVLSILYFGLMALVLYGMNHFQFMSQTQKGNDQSTVKVDFATFGIFNFPDIWHFMTYAAGLFFIIPAILIIITVCNEYEYRTIRQNLIDGLTRNEWVISKVFSILLITIASTLFITVMTLILGYSFSNTTENAMVWQKSNLIFIYFIQMLGYISFAFMLANLLKRAAITIGIFLLYTYAIEPIATYKFDIDLPMHHIRDLISAPIGKLINQTMNTDVSSKDIGLTLLYTVAFIAVTAVVNQRRDI